MTDYEYELLAALQERNRVFVRAQLPNGHWISADVQDLDKISFQQFVLAKAPTLAHLLEVPDDVKLIPNFHYRVVVADQAP